MLVDTVWNRWASAFVSLSDFVLPCSAAGGQAEIGVWTLRSRFQISSQSINFSRWQPSVCFASFLKTICPFASVKNVKRTKIKWPQRLCPSACSTSVLAKQHRFWTSGRAMRLSELVDYIIMSLSTNVEKYISIHSPTSFIDSLVGSS